MTSPFASLLASLFLWLAVTDGWLGVYLDPQSTAPRILECVPGSPAEKAGLRVGDVVVGVDATDVADGAAFTAAIRAHEAGDEVKLRLRRDGQDLVLAVVLAERPAQGGVPAEPATTPATARPRESGKRPSAPAPAPAPESRAASRPRLGLQVVEEHSALRVTAVAEGSAAARAGFREGDVLRRAGGTEVTSHAGLQAVVARGGSVDFVVQRGGEAVELRAELAAPVADPVRKDASGPRTPRRAPTPPARRAEPSPAEAPSTARADTVMPWLSDYDAAMAAAEKAGRSVLVLYGRDGDGPTQAQQRAFRSELVQDALPGYVAVYVERASNPELHEARKVRELPVLEIRNGDRTLWRHEGFLPPAALRAALKGDAPSTTRAAVPSPAVPPGPRPIRTRDEAGLQAEVEALRAEVRALQAELERLRRDAGGGR